MFRAIERLNPQITDAHRMVLGRRELGEEELKELAAAGKLKALGQLPLRAVMGYWVYALKHKFKPLPLDYRPWEDLVPASPRPRSEEVNQLLMKLYAAGRFGKAEEVERLENLRLLREHPEDAPRQEPWVKPQL